VDAQITKDILLQQLARVIHPEDDVVVIFSGIWGFGSKLGLPIKSVPNYLIDVICEFAGDSKTVVFPTYTYGFTKSRVFDVQHTKPETGILPNCAFKREDFKRTHCPLNSYAARGPKTEEIMSIQGSSIWADDSVMGWFDKVNAKICVLGETWHQACTHFHRIEEILQVPYRYYKTFPGEVLSNGEHPKKVEPKMFVRPLGVEMVRDYTKIEPIMKKHGFILESNYADLPLEGAKAQDIVTACRELFTENPYGYICNTEEISNWINTEKIQEMKGQAAILPT
jgi:aminoglycoside N3'-acetyltransferase